MAATTSKTHVAVALVSEHKLDAIKVPTRSPGKGEVLIKVDLASYGAADGHAVDNGFYVNSYPQIIGLVAVGKVVEVGSDVQHVKRGDLVGAYTMPGADLATQQYVVAPACRVCKIPESDGVNPADVAAIIDNFVTAWWTLANSLQLPLPRTWPFNDSIEPETASAPILIWGAGTASAQYTIQILKLLGFTNIIATASSRSSARAFTLGATHVLSYNDLKVADHIRISVGTGTPIKLAIDTVCTATSMRLISEVVTKPGSLVALLMPIKVGDDSGRHINEGGGVQLLLDLPREHNPFREGVNAIPTYTFKWESNAELRDNLLISIFPELLRSGQITSQPVRILKTGTLVERVREAASLVKNNQLNGGKAVIDFTAEA